MAAATARRPSGARTTDEIDASRLPVRALSTTTIATTTTTTTTSAVLLILVRGTTVVVGVIGIVVFSTMFSIFVVELCSVTTTTTTDDDDGVNMKTASLQYLRAVMHAASPSYDNDRQTLLCYTTASGDAHYFCYRDMDQRLKQRQRQSLRTSRLVPDPSDFPRRLENNALTYDARVVIILQFMIRELQARAREQQLQPVGPEGYTQQAEFNILLGEPHVLNTWRTALGVS